MAGPFFSLNPSRRLEFSKVFFFQRVFRKGGKKRWKRFLGEKYFVWSSAKGFFGWGESAFLAQSFTFWGKKVGGRVKLSAEAALFCLFGRFSERVSHSFFSFTFPEWKKHR